MIMSTVSHRGYGIHYRSIAPVANNRSDWSMPVEGWLLVKEPSFLVIVVVPTVPRTIPYSLCVVAVSHKLYFAPLFPIAPLNVPCSPLLLLRFIAYTLYGQLENKLLHPKKNVAPGKESGPILMGMGEREDLNERKVNRGRSQRRNEESGMSVSIHCVHGVLFKFCSQSAVL